MLDKLVLLICRRRTRFVCPCGQVSYSQARAIKHIGKHRSGIGRLDYDSGAVVW